MNSLLLFSPYIIRRLIGHKWTIKPRKVQNRKQSGSEFLKTAGFLDINGESSQEKSKTGSFQAVNS